MSVDLILPSEIPWQDLTGKDLEECLYWLMHGLGGRDLEWRLGGTGGGAADGGRDLEVHFFSPGPDGEIGRQKWWIEAKGRSSTIKPSVVKDSVLNAAGRSDLDIVIIATNSVFSNPIRDWLSTWQASHPRPVVRLWDRHHLERLLCEHPEVVIRLFARALSPQGKLEAVRSRFWNYTAYAGAPILDELWQKRRELDWSEMALLAVTISECANGDITTHPWPMTGSDTSKLTLFADALANIFSFCSRADDVGMSQGPYLNGAAYLLLACLQVHDLPAIVEAIHNACSDRDHYEHVQEIMRHAMAPVISTLSAQLRDVCTHDCQRVTMDPILLTDAQIDTYWQRLILPSTLDGSADDHGQVIIEKGDKPCNVGLPLSRANWCPITHARYNEETINIDEALKLLQTIVRARCSKISD